MGCRLAHPMLIALLLSLIVTLTVRGATPCASLGCGEFGDCVNDYDCNCQSGNTHVADYPGPCIPGTGSCSEQLLPTPVTTQPLGFTLSRSLRGEPVPVTLIDDGATMRIQVRGQAFAGRSNFDVSMYNPLFSGDPTGCQKLDYSSFLAGAQVGDPYPSKYRFTSLSGVATTQHYCSPAVAERQPLPSGVVSPWGQMLCSQDHALYCKSPTTCPVEQDVGLWTCPVGELPQCPPPDWSGSTSAWVPIDDVKFYRCKRPTVSLMPSNDVYGPQPVTSNVCGYDIACRTHDSPCPIGWTCPESSSQCPPEVMQWTKDTSTGYSCTANRVMPIDPSTPIQYTPPPEFTVNGHYACRGTVGEMECATNTTCPPGWSCVGNPSNVRCPPPVGGWEEVPESVQPQHKLYHCDASQDTVVDNQFQPTTGYMAPTPAEAYICDRGPITCDGACPTGWTCGGATSPTLAPTPVPTSSTNGSSAAPTTIAPSTAAPTSASDAGACLWGSASNWRQAQTLSCQDEFVITAPTIRSLQKCLERSTIPCPDAPTDTCSRWAGTLTVRAQDSLATDEEGLTVNGVRQQVLPLGLLFTSQSPTTQVDLSVSSIVVDEATIAVFEFDDLTAVGGQILVHMDVRVDAPFGLGNFKDDGVVNTVPQNSVGEDYNTFGNARANPAGVTVHALSSMGACTSSSGGSSADNVTASPTGASTGSGECVYRASLGFRSPPLGWGTFCSSGDDTWEMKWRMSIVCRNGFRPPCAGSSLLPSDAVFTLTASKVNFCARSLPLKVTVTHQLFEVDGETPVIQQVREDNGYLLRLLVEPIEGEPAGTVLFTQNTTVDSVVLQGDVVDGVATYTETLLTGDTFPSGNGTNVTVVIPPGGAVAVVDVWFNATKPWWYRVSDITAPEFLLVLRGSVHTSVLGVPRVDPLAFSLSMITNVSPLDADTPRSSGSVNLAAILAGVLIPLLVGAVLFAMWYVRRRRLRFSQSDGMETDWQGNSSPLQVVNDVDRPASAEDKSWRSKRIRKKLASGAIQI